MSFLTLITLQIFTRGGDGLSTNKIAAARDPRLRSPPAAHARRQSSRPGAWARSEVLVELLGEVPGEVLALPPRSCRRRQITSRTSPT